VGVAYAGDHLNMTLADGSADFIVGDTFTITVAAGSGKLKAYDADNLDGSQEPVFVLLEDADASEADADAVVGGAGVYVAANMTGLDAAARAALEARAIYFV
ncbi:MAG: head decoration protein, partial [Thermodesulfobacteriota bacterium]